MDIFSKGVGRLDQLVGTRPVTRIERNADAAGDGETQVIEREGSQHGFEHAARTALGTGTIGRMDEQHVLVRTQASHRVDLAQCGQQALGHTALPVGRPDAVRWSAGPRNRERRE